MYICVVIAFAESPLGGKRARHIHIKGVTERFGFDVVESRKFKLIVKNKATVTPLGDVYIQPALIVGVSSMTLQGEIYTHRRGAFSVARFDNQGNARALLRGTSIRLAPRFFVCMYESLLTGFVNLGRLMRRGF